LLACIEPEKPDHDRRTFECPQCEHVIVEVVKYK
jgi:transcription elongation factor Elf1